MTRKTDKPYDVNVKVVGEAGELLGDDVTFSSQEILNLLDFSETKTDKKTDQDRSQPKTKNLQQKTPSGPRMPSTG